MEALETAKKEAEKTGEDCPECGNPLVIRKGKYGSFTACSNYPKCKYIKADEKKIVEVLNKNIGSNYNGQVLTDIICPECGRNIYMDKTMVLTSYPEKYRYWCSCGW